MQNKEDIEDKPRQYLKEKAAEHHKNQILDSALQKAQHHVEHNIEDGSVRVAQETKNIKKEQESNQHQRKKEINPFDSRYKGFLLNGDRQKSQERYQFFKKLKQEYSKEKTAIVVKSVENKIKQWNMKKLQADRRLKKSKEHKKQIQLQMLEQLKRQEVQKKELEAFRKKQAMMKRLQIIEKRREEREELMKESSIRSRGIQSPKYIQIEKRFSQIQERLKQQRERVLQEKKLSMVLNAEQLQEHQKKYENILKQKKEVRSKKFKIKSEDGNSIEQRQEFDTIVDESSLQKKRQEEIKRQRRKEFQEKVKSIPVPTKPYNPENDDQKVKKSRYFDQNSDSLSKSRRKKSINTSVDARQLGNDYLKQLRSRDKSILGKSVSLPKLFSNKSLRPSYKNYLTEVKLTRKRKAVGDEIEQVKRRCQSKAEVYKQLSKKSQGYQENMLKKIKQLGRIQKYNESLNKEYEIDELLSRYINMRLACVDV